MMTRINQHTLEHQVHGRSQLESELVDGYALNHSRMAQGMPTMVKNVKIAMLDFALQRHRMQMGVNVVVKDVKELEKIKKREADITKERINKLLDQGVNVILTTKGIDDLCAKYLVEKKVIGVRRVLKKDLQRLALATGGQLLTNLADLEGDETVDPTTIGQCEECVEEEVGDRFVIYLRRCKGSGAATIVLRGVNEYVVFEREAREFQSPLLFFFITRISLNTRRYLHSNVRSTITKYLTRASRAQTQVHA